jgi:hypothetical protein
MRSVMVTKSYCGDGLWVSVDESLDAMFREMILAEIESGK